MSSLAMTQNAVSPGLQVGNDPFLMSIAAGEDFSPFAEELADLKPRIAVIDDDPQFLKLAKAFGELRGLDVYCFESLFDMGRVGHLASYDVAVIDYRLPNITGVEIAKYAESLFSDLPIVMISANGPNEVPLDEAGDCVRMFVCKDRGLDVLFKTIWRVYLRNSLS
jgi:DNA-binding NtrC family response regulator